MALHFLVYFDVFYRLMVQFERKIVWKFNIYIHFQWVTKMSGKTVKLLNTRIRTIPKEINVNLRWAFEWHSSAYECFIQKFECLTNVQMLRNVIGHSKLSEHWNCNRYNAAWRLRAICHIPTVKTNTYAQSLLFEPTNRQALVIAHYVHDALFLWVVPRWRFICLIWRFLSIYTGDHSVWGIRLHSRLRKAFEFLYEAFAAFAESFPLWIWERLM